MIYPTNVNPNQVSMPITKDPKRSLIGGIMVGFSLGVLTMIALRKKIR